VLHDAVKRHFEETGSQVAAVLLADWAGSIARFAKIMPTDYKRVLGAAAAAERSGLSEQETLDKIMEAAHG